MNNIEFANRLIEIAKNYKTLYVMGCFGAPMSKANKERYIKGYAYNAQKERKAMIEAASADTFGFDCVCLIKGVLWGWNGNKNAVYGGAKYCSNDVPDISTEQMIKACDDISSDFTKITIGEMLWMEGHAGIYIGNGLAVEASPKWENKVQITAVNCDKKGYNRRDWKKHGKLPYVKYEAVKEPILIELNHLKKGARGEEVKTIQKILTQSGFRCGGVDGDFGSMTEEAVKEFQRANKIVIDGYVGEKTWNKLLKG